MSVNTVLPNADFWSEDTTSAPISITLQAIIGRNYYVKNTGTGSNTLTVNYGTESVELDDNEMFFFCYDGIQWSTLAGGGGGGATSEGFLGEGASIGDLLYFASDGLLYLADNTDPIKSVVAGVCLKTGTTGTKVVVQKSGLLDIFTGITAGEDYYLGTAGAIVLASALADCDKKVFVGRAISTTAMDVNVQLPESDKTTITGVLGEAVTAGNPLYYGSDGKLYVASNDAIATSIVIGVALASGVLDDEICYQKIGVVSAYAGLTAGSEYFLGNAGAVVLRGAISDGEQIVSLGVANSTTAIDFNIQPPQVQEGSWQNAEIADIKYSAIYADKTDKGWIAFGYDNAISQSVYSALFSKIGHMFNAQHVEAGDADLSGSSTLFYPTPVPGKYGRVGIPDLSIDGTSLSLPTGFRNGTLFIVKSGTSQAVGTELYIRRVDASTVSYHSSEDGAINNTGVLTVTGSGVLTQEGVAVGDALEDHTHPYNVFSADASPTHDIGLSNVNIGWNTLNTDLVGDSYRSTNETRGTTYYEFGYIKAESVTPSGEPVSALRYDTGWIANSDWVDRTLNVTHNLNSALSNMIVKFVISTDGTDDNSFELMDTTKHYVSATEDTYGITIYQSDSNSIFFRTSLSGLKYIRDTDGDQVAIDNEAWYYKVVVTKPNLIANYAYAPTVRTITDAVDVIESFPSASELIGERVYERTGSGTGKYTLNCQSGEVLVLQDGTEISSIDLEGEATLKVYARAGKLKVMEFVDVIGIIDTSSEENRIYTKKGDGSASVTGDHINSSLPVTTSNGSVYISSEQSVIFGITPVEILTFSIWRYASTTAVWFMGGQTILTDGATFYAVKGQSVTLTDCVFKWKADVRWA